ncbi:MAG: thioredoxin-disulfide reductase [Eubacterium sp.]|nr:thioredoxin-disulfide reductase [Eubacterium sp.]MDD7209739.1 thioredoxin-disulfide reductase [Lachnospiraceae bacterium]MDY5498231.1 thioredoxin-disulfide reductase [Anaerobutyricum sp.]
MNEKIYDVLIIGGGPAGYSAALYCTRAGFDTLVLEKLSAGGQMALTMQIDNYPGFEDGIDGFSLAEKMKKGAERFGAQTRLSEVLSVSLDGPVKTVETAEGIFKGRTVIIAAGAVPRELGVPGEKELLGKGVGYCATCDGMFYRDKTVLVIGGGNTAAADALTLSRICKKVILVHRREELRATKIYHRQLEETENISFCWNSTVSEFLYDKKLTGAKIHNIISGDDSVVEADGAFISIGRKPASELFHGMIEMDPAGYIVADESTRTNIPGVFAVGDIRTKAMRQVVTAVSDGATASHYVEEYLAGMNDAE